MEWPSPRSSGASSARGRGPFRRPGDAAARSASDLLREPQIDCRWVSGQFSESNSKGKEECGLIKAIFPKEQSASILVNNHILQPNTVSPSETSQRPTVSWGFHSEQKTGECCVVKGVRETPPLQATVTREWQPLGARTTLQGSELPGLVSPTHTLLGQRHGGSGLVAALSSPNPKARFTEMFTKIRRCVSKGMTLIISHILEVHEEICEN